MDEGESFLIKTFGSSVKGEVFEDQESNLH